MTIDWKHCHQCGKDKPANQVLGNRCLQCRAETSFDDERPITSVLSPLNRQPTPDPQKKVGRSAQRV